MSGDDFAEFIARAELERELSTISDAEAVSLGAATRARVAPGVASSLPDPGRRPAVPRAPRLGNPAEAQRKERAR